ncbi:TIR domain-containing protein [Aerosakkonemataceae cyanobacterium BLCC-F50]|uniref:TIR domain-containing protein n=1 Tax=Floridaenema flaviceps BLCC-F50 TaxID=3153642 RepID=A0ABV4XS34_9CYAN
MTSVFISWTGVVGSQLATAIRAMINDIEGIKVWTSNEDIRAGDRWFTETQEALQNAEFGIVCLTPGSYNRPWINFEAGYLLGKGKQYRVVVVRFDENIENLINPLMGLQTIDGTNLNAWQKLIGEMTNKRNYDVNKDAIATRFSKLKETIDIINQSPHSSFLEINKKVADIQRIADSLKDNKYFHENICFQKVICEAYDKYSQLNENLKQRNASRYLAPASQYPQILISLQRNISPVVKAIALVNIEEQFWQQRTGKEILKTSNRDNIRVFAFASEKEFESNYLTLLEHAQIYEVYAISLTNLSMFLGSEYSKDFSIIDAGSNQKLLAKYDDEVPDKKNICFIAEEKEICQYEKEFNKLLALKVAIRIEKDADSDSETLKEQYRHSIFERQGLTFYERKSIEMSAYINASQYDEHEEKHAYYQEMMQKMIAICSAHRDNNIEGCRILEFGAGTGIFTKRLSEIKDIVVNEIVALEIDWHCYNILQHKFSNQQGRVQLKHKDSRTYNPSGQFDYIFSSFSDHHIKSGDKKRYFDNVKRNLKPGGLMIVGDEFLRDHPNNKKEREDALRDYHNHIIDIAKREGQTTLADLEEKALKSGLEEIGDFKVSCKDYEKYLTEAGFYFKQKRIGPPDPEEAKRIGGVYVYAACIADDSSAKDKLDSLFTHLNEKWKQSGC